MAETAFYGESLHSGSGMLAASNLSAAQHKAVFINSTGVVLCATQGLAGVKVLTNKPLQGDPCALIDVGETKVLAGAAVTKGAVVMTDSSGRFIPYVNNGVNVPVGECRVPAGALGDIFTIFLWPTPATAGAFEGAVLDSIVAHAGGGRASAVALVNGWNRIITVASATDSVVLPAAFAGMMIVVINDAAANAAQVFAAGSDTIDTVAGATGIPLSSVATATKGRAIFFCLTTGAWQTMMGPKAS